MEQVPYVTSGQREIAREIRETLDTLSPFIEKHTSIVCHDCHEVCCADRHGLYDRDDLIFLNALGIEVSQGGPAYDDNESCRNITEHGCKLERWMRPYRCTFFFCDALLKNLQNDNAKLYRAFNSYFNHLISLRQRLTEEG